MPRDEEVDLTGDRLNTLSDEHELHTRRRYTFRLPSVVLDIKSPGHEDVHVVGDRVDLDAVVEEGGSEVDCDLEWSATSGEIDPEEETLTLTDPGEVEVTAKLPETKGGHEGSVTIEAVAPEIASIELLEGPEGGNLHELFHGPSDRRMPPKLEYPEGSSEPTEESVHASFTQGTKVKAKVTLRHEKALTDPATVEIGLVSPPLDDEGTEKEGESWAGEPLALRLPEGERDGGTEVQDWSEELELESDRPLPDCIAAHEWDLSVRIRVKAGGADWTAPTDDLEPWRELGTADGVVVCAVHDEPKIGNGQDYDANSYALKVEEYDLWHVRMSCRWASGAWNLKGQDEFSIPLKVDNRFGHLKWPEDYEGRYPPQDSKPSNYSKLDSHPRGLYYSKGVCCVRCGGVVKGYGDDKTCDNCKRKVATDLSCSKCGSSFNSSDPFGSNFDHCTTDGRGIARYEKGKGYACPNCRRYNPSWPSGGSCRSCGQRLIRAIAACPGCDEEVPEEDLVRDRHICDSGEEISVHGDEMANFVGENWGFKVVTNRTNPGGRCNQQASCIAAINNALGLKAKCRYIKAPSPGALSTDNDDPNNRLTMSGQTSDCFRGKRDWGWNFHGICGVDNLGAEDEEWCYDGSFSSPYTGSWPPSSFSRCRKHGSKTDAVLSTWDRKPWGDRKNDDCRCDHEIPPDDTYCPDPGCNSMGNYVRVCGDCGEPQTSSWASECSSCGYELKGTYAKAIFSLCPSCRATVHISMDACWRCESSLPAWDLTKDWTW